MKDILIDDAGDGRQPDDSEHLKARQVVLFFQCQPAPARHTVYNNIT